MPIISLGYTMTAALLARLIRVERVFSSVFGVVCGVVIEGENIHVAKKYLSMNVYGYIKSRRRKNLL